MFMGHRLSRQCERMARGWPPDSGIGLPPRGVPHHRPRRRDHLVLCPGSPGGAGFPSSGGDPVSSQCRAYYVSPWHGADTGVI